MSPIRVGLRSARVLHVLSLSLALTLPAVAQIHSPESKPVKDADAAVKMAEKILIEKFGSGIKAERPFTAVLIDNVWRVSGSDHCGAPHCVGAPAVVEISEVDGRILAVYGPKK